MSSKVKTTGQIIVLAMALAVTSCLAHSQQHSGQAKGTEVAAVAAMPATGAEKAYVIGADDVLSISVWKEPDLSRTVTVRPDGKITLPLVGDVVATGLTTEQLEAMLNQKLAAYVSDPASTVSIQNSRSQKFDIVGEVQKPGSYVITTPVTVLDAISLAGGFREWAKQKKIYVLRKGPSGAPERLSFNYKDVIRGHHLEENVQLQTGDTVVIP